MRRKQQPAPQRRSEPRQSEPNRTPGEQAGFSAFTPTEERPQATPAASPPSLSTAPRSGGSQGGDGGSGRYDFLRPRNWRVPTRLIAILLIPVIISLVFGGLRVNTSVDGYIKASRAEKTAELAKAATELAEALENERDKTLIPLLTKQDPNNEVAKRRADTDAALKAYNAAYEASDKSGELPRRHDAFQILVADLPHLRANAYGPELFLSATASAYSTMFAPLLAYDNSVGMGSSNATSKGRAIYAMSLAKASASTQRALMLHLLVGIAQNGTTRYENADATQQIVVAEKLEQVSLNEFNTGSAPEDARKYSDAQVALATAQDRSAYKMPNGSAPTMQGLLALAAAYSQSAAEGQLKGKAAADASFAEAKASGLTPDNWNQAANTHIQALRNTEVTLLDDVLTDSRSLKDNALYDAILNTVIVVASLILAGLLTGYVARSMILGMRTLRSAALEIADHRLPDLVEKLSKTDPDRVDTSVTAIPLHGKDEIGEVARAFDQVHQQAVALAAEQALLRGNVNAIFTNLSRRSQGLIQRQLALITDLENNEADPDQLENLFKLDHLATRMRRNGENLLVLAGEEAGRRWNTPVPLVDVLRAAASEVEQYERVELSGIPEVDVVGAAVTDLVHLLAELLENATSFSSPQTRVLVNATRLPDGRVLVEIHDKGIGLTAEDFAEINEKLAEPPTVDATISRRMGLFVVGRLSQRHDIRVQLRPSGESAGTTSLVMLPPFVTQGGAAPEPEEQFTVSRIFADQQPTSEWAPDDRNRSAAELGFDDHLTGVGNAGSSGFSPALEAVQRSQRLDQVRRAALESGQEPPVVDAEVEEDYQQGYDQYAPQGYDQQQPYADDQYGYEQQGYRQDGYGPDAYGRYPQQQQGYDQQPYADEQYADDQYGYDGGGYQQDDYADQYGRQAQEAPAGHPYAPEPPALPAAEEPRSTLASGLPQRRPGEQLAGGGLGSAPVNSGSSGETPNWFAGAKDTSATPEPRGHDVSSLGGYGPTGPTASTAWQSPNDGDWQRAEQLREPSSAGTTGAGLPRRVPKQNLVPGNAQSAPPAPQEGPQVSRSPEEVRGRLTNLRRGVEQGRSAGNTGSFRIDPDQVDQSGNGQNRSTDLFGGSNHQER
ncbi:signal transduction histidine kinase [Streptomyces sp. 1114.5]|uniref:sensor histidine kinase n=1 Tax=unclassified Streptomyces TaxID=2593676 RepID=UPI000BD76F39|nr:MULTISPECIES: nitrate- and nitrite sensing domain-containing protein [unclassified Streptomyces]RKT15777.1 signal transduction histidine kinase [Streptomyces sp. 1114.5]SOB81953.1 Signal transduction histidine kinase [Streptomyces sp. 1331.2]